MISFSLNQKCTAESLHLENNHCGILFMTYYVAKDLPSYEV